MPSPAGRRDVADHADQRANLDNRIGKRTTREFAKLFGLGGYGGGHGPLAQVLSGFVHVDRPGQQSLADQADDVFAQCAGAKPQNPFQSKAKNDDAHHPRAQQDQPAFVNILFRQVIYDIALKFQRRRSQGRHCQRQQDQEDLASRTDAPDGGIKLKHWFFRSVRPVSSHILRDKTGKLTCQYRIEPVPQLQQPAKVRAAVQSPRRRRAYPRRPGQAEDRQWRGRQSV